ncbi:MAG: signal recognition particle protein Srp54 [Candidatus Bathyarchaeia archaeon]
MVLEKLGSSIYSALRKLVRAPLVDERVVRELVHEIQRALLRADVNVNLVLELTERIRDRVLKEKLPSGISRHEHTVKVVYDELTKLLGERTQPLSIQPDRQNVILLVGIQGSGKTTTAVKLAAYYRSQGIRSAVVCADSFRPGAFAQIKQFSEKAGVPAFGDPSEKDPIKLAQRGVEEFRDCNVVIIDTAGRHKDERALMDQVRRLAAKIKPDHTILVIDATIGQQAMAQAKAFHETSPIGSIFVTKLDGAAKGGGALSAVAATGAPITFLGVGERVEDVEEFDPPRFVGRLLGMGDIRGLVEKVRAAREAEMISEEGLEEVLKGKLTLDTMYEQMSALRKMGRFRRLLSMIPGLGYSLPDEALEEAEEKLSRWKVIIQSMTKSEREKPGMINASRVRRIARGSGTSEKDVRDLLRQFRNTKRMLKTLRKRRGPLRLMRGLEIEPSEWR